MPYNPQQQFDARPLFEGIRQFGNNIAQEVERRRADSQKFKSLRSVAESYAPELKGTFDGMSLGELEGTVRAFTLSQALDEQKANRALRERGVAVQERQVSLAEAAQQAGLASRQRDEEAATGFQGRLAEIVQGGPLADGFREPGQLSLADIVKAAGSSGYRLPPGALMDAIRTSQVDPEAQAPREFQVGGRAGVYSPRTGAFDLLPPDGLTPAQKQAAALNLQRQWIEITRDMADPVKAASINELKQARQMLEDQFASLGLKPPARDAAEPKGDTKPDARGRMRFDSTGKPVKQ